MKLCITSTGKDMDSRVDEHFGRASCFMIVDTATMDFEVVSNTAQAAEQGAGISAAQIILDKGAEALLTGIVGPKAFSALRAANVKVYEGASGADSVRGTVEKFNRGEYSEASVPSGGPGRGGRFRGGR